MSPAFELVQDLYVINIWFKFEDKIQYTSKVIVFTRNHTDEDDADDGTKNNMSPPGRGEADINISKVWICLLTGQMYQTHMILDVQKGLYTQPVSPFEAQRGLRMHSHVTGRGLEGRLQTSKGVGKGGSFSES